MQALLQGMKWGILYSQTPCLSPHAQCRGWVPSRRLRAQCSLLLSQGDMGITESVYLTYAQKPPGKTSITFTDSALQLVLHIPLYTPVLTWPAHVPNPCKSPLFPLLPVAIHCCKHLKTRPVPIMLLCRKCVSNFSAQYLSSPKPGRLLWERNSSAQKNECCITAAINTELFLFLQHLQYQDITKPVPN